MKLEKFKDLEIGKILDHIIVKDKGEFVVSDQSSIGEATKKILDNKYKILALTDHTGKVDGVISNSDIIYNLSYDIDLNIPLINIKPRIKFNQISVKDNVRKLLNTIIDYKMDNIVVVGDVGEYYGVINKYKLKEVIDDIVD